MWHLGVSKSTFKKDCVIPANDNDTFNDGKCAYCWGPYNVDHPAVRILPCNHVFGKVCLEEWLKENPTADKCIICRAQLFRPNLQKTIGALLLTFVQRLALSVLALKQKVLVLYEKLPRPIKLLNKIVWVTVHVRNPYFVAREFLKHCTNVERRNPLLNISNMDVNRAILFDRMFSMDSMYIVVGKFLKYRQNQAWTTHCTGPDGQKGKECRKIVRGIAVGPTLIIHHIQILYLFPGIWRQTFAGKLCDRYSTFVTASLFVAWALDLLFSIWCFYAIPKGDLLTDALLTFSGSLAW